MTEPTDWCAPIVVAPKKGTDKIRMCVEQGRAVPISNTSWSSCQSRAKHFTVFGALTNAEADHLHHTFWYLRAPYEISSISEYYNRQMDEAVNGIQMMLSYSTRTKHNMCSTFVRSCVAVSRREFL